MSAAWAMSAHKQPRSLTMLAQRAWLLCLRGFYLSPHRRASSEPPVVFYPSALRPGNKTRGAARLARTRVNLAPDFEWLRDLRACESTQAKHKIRRLLQNWITASRHPRGSWEGSIVARRLMNWSATLPWLLSQPGRVAPATDAPTDAPTNKPSNKLWDDATLLARASRAMRRQHAWLARTALVMPAGHERLSALIGAAWGEITLNTQHPKSPQIWQGLEDQLGAQVLLDGGHISRSPQQLAELLGDLLGLYFAARQCGYTLPAWLGPLLGRMFPMLRFFLLGDGRLATFHGGGAGESAELGALLSRDRKARAPFRFAPQSRYFRLAAGGSIVVMDVGAPVSDLHSTRAHLAPLALEMSSGSHRLLVSCGPGPSLTQDAQQILRGAAAHSCLSLDEAPPGEFGRDGRIARAASDVQSRQLENNRGLWVEASHDGYGAQTRLLRRIFLSADGRDLRGEEQFLATDNRSPDKNERSFALCFHLHPDVDAALNAAEMQAVLTLPNQERWHFSAVAPPGTSLRLEESLYAPDAHPRASRQLVLGGVLPLAMVHLRWSLRCGRSGQLIGARARA